MPLEKNHKN